MFLWKFGVFYGSILGKNDKKKNEPSKTIRFLLHKHLIYFVFLLSLNPEIIHFITQATKKNKYIENNKQINKSNPYALLNTTKQKTMLETNKSLLIPLFFMYETSNIFLIFFIYYLSFSDNGTCFVESGLLSACF